jgi:hypothetical protein
MRHAVRLGDVFGRRAGFRQHAAKPRNMTARPYTGMVFGGKLTMRNPDDTEKYGKLSVRSGESV